RAEPTGGAGLSPPADARAAAQVYAEDSAPELLQVGVPPADGSIFPAKTAALIPAAQDKRLFEDPWLATPPARHPDAHLQRSSRSATRPEQVGRMLAHGRGPRGRRRLRKRLRDESVSKSAHPLSPLRRGASCQEKAPMPFLMGYPR